MKKRIFIAVFFIILLIPFVGMSVYHADLSIEKKHEEALPSLILSGHYRLCGRSFCIPSGNDYGRCPDQSRDLSQLRQ